MSIRPLVRLPGESPSIPAVVGDASGTAAAAARGGAMVDGPPLSPEQYARYSRQIMLPGFGERGQLRLLAARALVVGAGGLGSSALAYLAAAGVGTIGIVDDDAVETSNLHRQVIHDSAGVGAPKTASAAVHLRALNPDVHVVEHRLRLTDANARELIAGYDVVLDGSDNFPTRYAVDGACSELSIPEVWASILRYSAQVSVFWTGPRAAAAGAPDVCLRDLFPRPPAPGTTPSCGEAGVLGSLCGQVGSVMAGEAIKLLTGTGEPLIGRVLVMDALRSTYEEVPLVACDERPAASGPEHASGPGGAGQGSAAPVGAGEQVGAGEGAVGSCDVGELSRLLASGERDVVVLDVRKPYERQICAIEGSVHIPLDDVLADPRAAARALGGRPVYVYCLSGARSARAARALAGVGAEVTNVEGGIRAWWTHIDPAMQRY
ncbi:MAG: ThiF family adenylyltransferase [Actinomycetaceae bacterium]|nr:ThiF family adenylyltransferase [Actinomycetaceae bacterium]